MARPTKFAHFVLRTSNFTEVLDWWKTALEAEARYQNDFIAFISYDDEHHRVAVVNMGPDTPARDPRSVGFDHVAFTFGSLDDLLGNYTRLKDAGVEPYWTIHHGMTVSAYYRDPDGNQVEFQVDVCDLDQADEFMRSDVFAANPIGVALDFDDLVARRAAGESVEALTVYVSQPA